MFKGEKRNVAVLFPDIRSFTSISKIYIERCEGYMKNPPSADWDGVEVLDFK